VTSGIIRPDIFKPFPSLIAGISTREVEPGGAPMAGNMSFNVDDAPEHARANRTAFVHALGLREDALAIPRQIHSDRVQVVRTPGVYPDCDALLTDEPGVVLSVMIADCVPIFLFDPRAKVVGLVHAGWRGSAAGVTTQAIETMNAEFGTAAADLLAYIGPAAGVCCYEVGEDVTARFSGDVSAQRIGKWYVDLKLENHRQLRSSGVPESRIERCPACTICTPTLHSYRRDGRRSGRMIGLLGMMITKGA
jgi:YfiH family protein